MLGAVLPGGGYSAADDIITSKPGKEGIYEFVDTTGKKYVGQSSDIPQRLQQHIDSGKLDPGKHVDVNPMPAAPRRNARSPNIGAFRRSPAVCRLGSRTRCRTSEIPSDPSDNICSMIPRKQVDGGFIIEQEHLPGSCYVLTDSWQPRYEEVMVREGVHYLRLNRTLGARYENLEFLRALGFLRGVEIYDWDVKELTPLLALPQLELLGLQCQFKNIDFAAHFPRLQLASFIWRPGSESFLTCRTLALLFVEGYPFEDLTPLSKLGALRRLHVNSRQLVRASGAEQLPELKHLTFAFCPALSDIEDLARCQAIEVLEFNCCKKLAELSPLSSLKRLRRLLIENGAQIASIKPLRHDEALEEVYLPGTKIGDGDLRPLLDLPNLRRVAFPKSRKHSHTMDQINAALARRA